MRYEIGFVDLQAQPVAVVRGHARIDEISDFLGGAFGEVLIVLDKQGQHPTGPPFGRYRSAGDGFDVEAGFACSAEVEPEGRVEADQLPGGRVARTLHVGPYGDVGAAYEASIDWLTEEGYEVAGAPWESYLDGPEVPEPRTEVFIPCTPVRPLSEG
jgi:effector-binding domain-containing protein